jgi:hypothetical protein
MMPFLAENRRTDGDACLLIWLVHNRLVRRSKEKCLRFRLNQPDAFHHAQPPRAGVWN